jgi:hypothetical protein
MRSGIGVERQQGIRLGKHPLRICRLVDACPGEVFGDDAMDASGPASPTASDHGSQLAHRQVHGRSAMRWGSLGQSKAGARTSVGFWVKIEPQRRIAGISAPRRNGDIRQDRQDRIAVVSLG